MPEPVLYMRGLPSSLIDRIADTPAMLEDLKAVAELSDGQVRTVQSQISEAKGFLDPKALKAILRSVVGDDAKAGSVQRTIRNLKPNDVAPFLKALSQQQSSKGPPGDPALLARLHQVLPALVQHYPALARFEKAERLAGLTGQKLETAELICDIRPIFDEAREQIEGMMPYTRVRLVATGADGLPIAFEAELTRRQVQELSELASKAAQKLGVLQKSIEEKWLPGGVPDLPLTREPRKDGKDA